MLPDDRAPEVMNAAAAPNYGGLESFLSELIGARVFRSGKKIGKLGDIVVVEREKIPEATHLLVDRPFGEPAILVPWERVTLLSPSRVEVDVESPEAYVRQPQEGDILLKDHVLDKKVLDTEGKEVEIVYDVRLSLRNGRLYVVGVDLSRCGLLRRLGLTRLAGVLGLREKSKAQVIAWTYIRRLPTDLGSFRGALTLNVLKEELSEMHPVDVADILETMESEQRSAILEGLDTERASDALEEIDPNVQRDLVLSLRREKVSATPSPAMSRWAWAI
jgi:magnesium transporter